MRTPFATTARHQLAAALLCATGALIAACGTAVPQAPGNGSTPTQRPPAGPSPAATTPAASATAPGTPAGRAGAPGCASSALTAQVDTSQASATAGSTYYPIDFTNSTSASCTLYGYPGVSFVTAPGGHQLGRAAIRNAGVTPRTVTLRPGGIAHAAIQVADAGNFPPSQCRPVTGHWLRIYPPGQYVPVYAAFTTQVCSGRPAGGNQLAVFAVRTGAGTAGGP